MPPDIIDLLDSDDELPSLAERLHKKRDAVDSGSAAARYAAPAAQQTAQAAAAAQQPAPRPPLSAVHRGNHSGGGSQPAEAKQTAGATTDVLQQPWGGGAGPSDLLAGAEALRRRQQLRAERKAAQQASAEAAAAAAAATAAADGAGPSSWQADPVRLPQYHQQEARHEQQQQEEEQQQQQEHDEAGVGCSPGSSPAAPSGSGGGGGGGAGRAPARGRRRASLPSQQQEPQQDPPPWQSSAQQQQQQQQQLGAAADDDDNEWQLPGDSQAPSQQAVGAAAGGKKQKRPKRTKEEIERDNALKAQQREDNKRLRQAGTNKWALQQVRLLVDTALMASSSSGGGGSGALGVQLLAHLSEYNSRLSAAAAEKRINYDVAPLDLAPFRALRWQRRRLADAGAGAGAGAASQQFEASQVPESQLEEQWEEEPHIMVCLQPQEFIDAVCRDRLSSLFSLLERRAAGQRHYLMVCGLANHICKQERQGQQASMRTGAQIQESVKQLIESFLTGLAVECPGLGFRDVVDAAQAAQHVQLVTVAIAAQHFKESDATVWLRAHDKTDTQALTNLLINHPLEDRSLEPVARSLAVLPSVTPAIAHVLASQYGSLGGLMHMLLDASRSDADKTAEMAEMGRVGSKNNMRVGPAAARQLLQLLTAANPDLKIKRGAGE